MNNNLSKIIEATRTKELTWSKDSFSNTFKAYSADDFLYSISEKSSGEIVFDAIDEKGHAACHMTSYDDLGVNWTERLYDTIINANPELRNFVDSSVSLTKVKERLAGGMELNTKSNSSFKYIQTNKTYVEPNFSQQKTLEGMTPIDQAQVITISASGATGKTALTEHISSILKIPVFDMQQHEAVGSNSLLGMLFNTLSIGDFSSYIQSLKDGEATMIIDALDEGYVKTNNSAFESFLKDVVTIATDNKGVPFVIMGRTSVIEYATMFLEDNGVRVCMLQIEPFIRKKAEEFIDVVLTEKRGKEITYKKEYKDVRNYILDSLQAFFKNESDINKRQSERFIGYAPVLQSIATLLHEKEQNYFQLKAELEKNDTKNVSLIRNIIEMILKREQGKVTDEIRNLLQNMHYSNVESIIDQCYDINEQCARILRFVNGNTYEEKKTGDAAIDEKYEELIKKWFTEHPFIVEKKIQNIVFEGYIVSRLIGIDKYRDDVIDYLDCNWRNSYILFDLYNIMESQNREIDMRFVKYLIDSYKATEKGYNRHFVEIIANNNQDNSEISCELAFEELGDEEYDPYVFILSEGDVLELPSSLSNIYIDAPICISCNKKHVEFSPMVNITCKKMIIPSEDVLITPARLEDTVVIECDEFEGARNGKMQNISNNGKVAFTILTDTNLYYPFASYKKRRRGELPEDETFVDKYQKLRRTIVQFRAHSKGNLAKFKDKIDNRIGNTEVGKRVIEGLLREGVLEERRHMYFINDKMMSEKLGLGYNELRTYDVNSKVKDFLNSI